jgi:hypothetical protein
MQRSRRVRIVNSEIPAGGIILIALTFFCAGVFSSGWLYFPTLHDWWRSRGWVETPCRAELIHTPPKSGDGRTTAKITVSYRYQFEDKSFVSNRFGPGPDGDEIKGKTPGFLANGKRGADKSVSATCTVNPTQPDESFLSRELRVWHLAILSFFPTVFPLAAIALAFGGSSSDLIRSWRKKHPGEPWFWRKEWQGRIIKPETDGFWSALMCGLWLLAVQAPFALAILLGGQITRTSFAWLLLLPALLSLVLFWRAWKKIQTRFSWCQVILELEKTPLHPGETFSLNAVFPKNPELDEWLPITVICREHLIQIINNRSRQHSYEVWRDRRNVSANALRQEGLNWRIPIKLEIPSDLPCSDPALIEQGIIQNPDWTTRLEIHHPRHKSAITFMLPLFRKPRSGNES